MIIQSGVDLNQIDCNGQSILELVAKHNCCTVEILKLMLMDN